MSTPIPNVNNASKEELIKELTLRSVDPATTFEALRKQARAFNITLKQSCAQSEGDNSVCDSEDDASGSNSDDELNNETKGKVTLIKKTKIIYKKSSAHGLGNWDYKYDGKTCVRDFLLLVDERCRSRGISHDELMKSFTEILDGIALLWYRSIYHSDLKWEDFSNLLIKQFEGEGKQLDLKAELFNLRQPKGMSVFEFSLRMKALNNKLDAKLPEPELLQLAMKALLPTYANLLAARDFVSFEDLTRAAARLESLSEVPTSSSSNFKDVEFPEKSTNYRKFSSSDNKYSFNLQHKNSYSHQKQQRPPNTYNKVVYTRNQPSPPNNRIICDFCNKSGHKVTECWKKASGTKNAKVGTVHSGTKPHNQKN